MRLREILSEDFSNEELLNIARQVGAQLFSSSHTGFVFPENPKVVRMNMPADFSYDTYQIPFKPSEKKGYDRSDSPVDEGDIDVDGLLYVIDAEDGVLVMTPDSNPKQDTIKSRLENLGYKLVSKIGTLQVWYPKAQEYRPGCSLRTHEHELLVNSSDRLFRLETVNSNQDFDSLDKLLDAANKL